MERSPTREHRVIRGLEQHAADFLARFQRPHRHHLACAMLLTDGREVLGLNIVSNVGIASVCAEQVTLADSMKLCPGGDVSLIITLRATFSEPVPHEIVPPCGRCREILYEYAPASRVALGGAANGTYELVPVQAMLPRPFYRRRPAAGAVVAPSF